MSTNQLALEAESLSLGESTQVYCPFCDNQAPWSKSMSLTRVEDGAVFYCFRPVCNASGHVSINGKVRTKKQKNDSINPFREYNADLYPLLVDSRHYREDWVSEGVKVNNRRGTLVFPVYDCYGNQFGWVDRSYSGRTPKSLNYIDPTYPKVHYPRAYRTNNIAPPEEAHIVEDIPSAIAVCKYTPCVSILGTSLPNDALEELQARFERITICLDKDATSKAIKLKRQLRTLFQEVNVKFLPKDPKDMNDEELQAYFAD